MRKTSHILKVTLSVLMIIILLPFILFGMVYLFFYDDPLEDIANLEDDSDDDDDDDDDDPEADDATEDDFIDGFEAWNNEDIDD